MKKALFFGAVFVVLLSLETRDRHEAQAPEQPEAREELVATPLATPTPIPAPVPATAIQPSPTVAPPAMVSPPRARDAVDHAARSFAAQAHPSAFDQARIAQALYLAELERNARVEALGLDTEPVRIAGRRQALVDVRNGRIEYVTQHGVVANATIAADLVQGVPGFGAPDGSSLRVALWDIGNAFAGHQELSPRVGTPDFRGNDGHATHTTGLLAGAGVNPSAVGVAPQVTLDSYFFDNDNSELVAAGALWPGQPGRVVTGNNSYGFVRGWNRLSFTPGTVQWRFEVPFSNPPVLEDPEFGRYSANARDMDAAALATPYTLTFRSAGNDRIDNPQDGQLVQLSQGGNAVVYDSSNPNHPGGDGLRKGGFDTLYDAALAKNVVSVGGVTQGNRDGAGNLLNTPVLQPFSVFGPTDDGRIKPDLVAFGGDTFSASSSGPAAYGFRDGTSMSAPTANGAAILLQDIYTSAYPGHFLRSSTLKALLLHTADDLGNPGPDYQFGWGLLNTRRAAEVLSGFLADPVGSAVVESYLEDDLASQSFTRTSDGIGPLVVTLVWDDLPGAIVFGTDQRGPTLVHDLDLVVQGPAGIHQPWVMPFTLDPASAPDLPATRGVNRTDNVEQVVIPSPLPGEYTITVSRHGEMEAARQVFSMIVSGARREAPATSRLFWGYVDGPGRAKAFGEDLPLGTDIVLRRDGFTVEAVGEEVLGDEVRFRFDPEEVTPGEWELSARFPGSSVSHASAPLVVAPVSSGTLLEDSFAEADTGWSTETATGAATWFRTLFFGQDDSTAYSITSPGSGAGALSDAFLLSPEVLVPADAQSLVLSFQHNYNIQLSGSARDGGVLEYRLDGGEWADVSSTGVILFGNYNAVVSAGANPLFGRPVWSGVSSGWEPVTVFLDAAAASGRLLQLRWRLGTDEAFTSNWTVDVVRLEVEADTPMDRHRWLAGKVDRTQRGTPELTDFLADLDGDGASGLAEYSHDTNLLRAIDFPREPVIEPAGGSVQAVYTQWRNAFDLTVTPQFTTRIPALSPTPVTPASTEDLPFGRERVTITLPGGDRGFLWLEYE